MATLNVTLTSNRPCTIYYTTNGVDPTVDSTVYAAPIALTEPTTLKFFAISEDGVISDIKTETYTQLDSFGGSGGDPPPINDGLVWYSIESPSAYSTYENVTWNGSEWQFVPYNYDYPSFNLSTHVGYDAGVTWQVGLRPSKIRVTTDNSALINVIVVDDNGTDILQGLGTGLLSGAEVAFNWDLTTMDMMHIVIYGDNAFNITNIELLSYVPITIA